jgi:hypothetical protein
VWKAQRRLEGGVDSADSIYVLYMIIVARLHGKGLVAWFWPSKGGGA